MLRPILAVAAALMLLVGCAQSDAPRSVAAPAPVTAPAAAKPAADAAGKALPSPLINQPGKGAQIISGGSPQDCAQQCEHSYQVCMDGSAARDDLTSGQSRMFGPAARCEVSLASCMKRCKAIGGK